MPDLVRDDVDGLEVPPLVDRARGGPGAHPAHGRQAWAQKGGAISEGFFEFLCDPCHRKAPGLGGEREAHFQEDFCSCEWS